MRQSLVNGRVLLDDGFTTNCAVLVNDGRIEAILPADARPPPGTMTVDLERQLLLPGFIDIQVNGGGGVLLNSQPTVAGIAAIGRAHREHGTTGFLPTVISDDLAIVEQAMAAVDAAIAAGVPGVLGIHIEGPFLSEARRGVHDAKRLRTPEAGAVTLLGSLRNGRTVVTLAPECAPPGFIERLADAGVLVCAGHTNATYAQIAAARRQGLRGFTHLFNAMSPLTSREPGVVGAALSDSDAWCGIIVDGHHVDPVVLRIALAAKRHDRFLLVSDAMACVGTPLREFDLQGRRIEVRDGRCVDERGTLAGTAIALGQAVRNAVALLGLAPAEAVRMAGEYPARFLGLDNERGRIAPGYRADFVLADDALNVTATWIGGRREHETRDGGRAHG